MHAFIGCQRFAVVRERECRNATYDIILIATSNGRTRGELHDTCLLCDGESACTHKVIRSCVAYCTAGQVIFIHLSVRETQERGSDEKRLHIEVCLWRSQWQ
jgi:hypothetical protein